MNKAKDKVKLTALPGMQRRKIQILPNWGLENLTLIGMSYESKKNAHLALPRGIFYKTQLAWQGVKLTL